MYTGQLFYEWLIMQSERNDSIGELAKVALNNSDAKTVKNYRGDWIRYFKTKSVSPTSMAMVGRAWTQYRQAKP